MDGEYKADRPLTEAERLVNVAYLGHCLHEERKVWKSPMLGWASRCTSCKKEIDIGGYSQAKRLPDDVLAQAWADEHVKTASSSINGSQLQYVMEQQGWRIRFFGVGGRSACEVQKQGRVIRTPFMDSQAEAMVEAGAMSLGGYISRAGLDRLTSSF